MILVKNIVLNKINKRYINRKGYFYKKINQKNYIFKFDDNTQKKSRELFKKIIFKIIYIPEYNRTCELIWIK